MGKIKRAFFLYENKAHLVKVLGFKKAGKRRKNEPPVRAGQAVRRASLFIGKVLKFLFYGIQLPFKGPGSQGQIFL